MAALIVHGLRRGRQRPRAAAAGPADRAVHRIREPVLVLRGAAGRTAGLVQHPVGKLPDQRPDSLVLKSVMTCRAVVRRDREERRRHRRRPGAPANQTEVHAGAADARWSLATPTHRGGP